LDKDADGGACFREEVVDGVESELSEDGAEGGGAEVNDVGAVEAGVEGVGMGDEVGDFDEEGGARGKPAVAGLEGLDGGGEVFEDMECGDEVVVFVGVGGGLEGGGFEVGLGEGREEALLGMGNGAGVGIESVGLPTDAGEGFNEVAVAAADVEVAASVGEGDVLLDEFEAALVDFLDSLEAEGGFGLAFVLFSVGGAVVVCEGLRGGEGIGVGGGAGGAEVGDLGAEEVIKAGEEEALGGTADGAGGLGGVGMEWVVQFFLRPCEGEGLR
jgi:hypothetical protein